MITAKTRLAVVLGQPVVHSRSPAMFNAAFAARRVDACYLAWALDAAALPGAIATLAVTGALGANVTVPHKTLAARHVTRLSSAATSLQCVNCITFAGGESAGENTDVFGFAESLRRAQGARQLAAMRRAPAVILGAGGAARAVVWALAELGFADLRVFNRGAGRRREFSAFAARAGVHGLSVAPWAGLGRHLGEARLVVNATSAEVKHEALDLSLGGVHRGALVYDLTYGRPPLVAAAKKAGLAAMDGTLMLLYQAAEAFRLWTGKKAPVEVMRRALGARA